MCANQFLHLFITVPSITSASQLLLFLIGSQTDTVGKGKGGTKATVRTATVGSGEATAASAAKTTSTKKVEKTVKSSAPAKKNVKMILFWHIILS